MINQHEYVSGCKEYYEDQGFYPGDGGNWVEVHYPAPKWAGGEEVTYLLWEHHQVQGVLQTLEFPERPCFYAGDVSKFFKVGNFCCSWFELQDVFQESCRVWANRMNEINHSNLTEEGKVESCSRGGRTTCHIRHKEKDSDGRSLYARSLGRKMNQTKHKEKDVFGRSLEGKKSCFAEKSIPIVLFNPSKDEVFEFNNSIDAALCLNLNPRGVRRVSSGERVRHKGWMVWRVVG